MSGVELDLTQPVGGYKINGQLMTSESLGNLLALIETCYEILSGQGGTNPQGDAIAAIQVQLNAIQGALSADQTAVLAAIQGVQAGTVDVAQLAQALVPILAPADAAAFQAALATAGRDTRCQCRRRWAWGCPGR